MGTRFDSFDESREKAFRESPLHARGFGVERGKAILVAHNFFGFDGLGDLPYPSSKYLALTTSVSNDYPPYARGVSLSVNPLTGFVSGIVNDPEAFPPVDGGYPIPFHGTNNPPGSDWTLDVTDDSWFLTGTKGNAPPRTFIEEEHLTSGYSWGTFAATVQALLDSWNFDELDPGDIGWAVYDEIPEDGPPQDLFPNSGSDQIYPRTYWPIWETDPQFGPAFEFGGTGQILRKKVNRIFDWDDRPNHELGFVYEVQTAAWAIPNDFFFGGITGNDVSPENETLMRTFTLFKTQLPLIGPYCKVVYALSRLDGTLRVESCENKTAGGMVETSPPQIDRDTARWIVLYPKIKRFGPGGLCDVYGSLP